MTEMNAGLFTPPFNTARVALETSSLPYHDNFCNLIFITAIERTPATPRH